ncbi:hypothetical protein N0V84_009400 [Fusarium piperis]|uniref:Protein kinase domain-containing protein n=1 Tax=Fusarium piperis TaxID=1435070 RepID=A0A9W8W6E9_9HYPO|nr:hypothetical protein N0V84_009400 [Fusarium piperis]
MAENEEAEGREKEYQRRIKALEDRLLKAQRQQEEEQRQREEEQHRRHEAEDRLLEAQRQQEEEQRRREEEQHRRHEAEDRLLEAQRQQEEEQRRREEEQHRRHEAEDRLLGEQRLREEAEKITRSLTLQPFLETCHSLSLGIKIITDVTLTTQGDTTNPTGRVYPKQIIPWTTFAEEQEKVWDKLASSSSFPSRPVFTTPHNLDYVKHWLPSISSENSLRIVERDILENRVQELVKAVYNDSSLRKHIGLDGTVTFQSHTNLGATDDSLSKSTEQVLPGFGTPTPARQGQKPRGKGGIADQFCIYRTTHDKKNIPIVSIEYKAPHKLTRDEIVTGLASEIQPERDVINKEGEGFEFASRRLAAAVVTQLFSYMVSKDLRYGYIDTGEAYVFLHIPDDPTRVYFAVSVPSLDVQDDDEGRLHRTAVAQAFAFVLQAIQPQPIDQAWRDACFKLKKWDVEFENILLKTPKSDRKPRKNDPTYKAQRWKDFRRSPIMTRLRRLLPDTQQSKKFRRSPIMKRSRCLPPQDRVQRPSRNDSDNDDENPAPMPNSGVGCRGALTNTSTDIGSSEMVEQNGSSASQEGTNKRPNIEDRQYCTHECLRGLQIGGAMDEKCPNFSDHGKMHITQGEFLRLARDQLAVDRGPDADCAPLYLSGSRGSLFKFRLSSHGYTLVAKGVQAMHSKHLRYEAKIYSQVQGIQGKFVPVCLDVIDLIKPYYYHWGVYTHFLFLSYGGLPVLSALEEVSTDTADEILVALSQLHQRGVLHRDAEPRNVLYDERTERCMIVDLMLSEVCTRQSLKPVRGGGRNRGKRASGGQQKGDAFAIEAESLRASLTRQRRGHA